MECGFETWMGLTLSMLMRVHKISMCMSSKE